MEQFVDLTIFSDMNTPVYPGDPKPVFERVAQDEKDGWNEHRITINTHFGTHIDSPFHMFSTGKSISDYELDKFIGRGIVLDVRGQHEIDVELDDVKQNDIVLLWTNHISKARENDFYIDPPTISSSFAEKLIAKKVKLVGLDSYSPDLPPFPIHKALLSNEILIVENIDNLKSIYNVNINIFVLPMKFNNLDGAPCRVIAQIV